MVAMGGLGESPSEAPTHHVPSPPQSFFNALPPFNPQPKKGTPRLIKKAQKLTCDLEKDQDLVIPVPITFPLNQQSNTFVPSTTSLVPKKISFKDTLMGNTAQATQDPNEGFSDLFNDERYIGQPEMIDGIR